MINCPTHYVHSSCGADAVYSRHAVNRSAELSIVHFVWGPKLCRIQIFSSTSM